MIKKKQNKKLKYYLIGIILASIITGIYTSSYIDQILTSKFSNFEYIKYSQAVIGLFKNEKQLVLFLLHQLLGVTIAILVWLNDGKSYKSNLMEITPEIFIPEPSGQGQFGTARFAKEEEIEKEFEVNILNSNDEIIKKLLKGGGADQAIIKDMKIETEGGEED